MKIDRHLMIDPALWRRVKIKAVQSDVTITELVGSLLRDGLKPVGHEENLIVVDGPSFHRGKANRRY